MKITGVKAVYPKYRHVVPSWRTHFWQIVVRVETDTGNVGFGYGGGGVAGVEIVNRHFQELLLGKQVDSVGDIASIWDHLYEQSLPYGRKGLAIMALSGVDLALFDLLGKAQGQPVYEVLGGAQKSRALCYATGRTRNSTPISGFGPTSFRTAGAETLPTTRRPLPLHAGPGRSMGRTRGSWSTATCRGTPR